MTLPVLQRFTALTGQDAGEWGAAICKEARWPVTKANVYTFAGWFREEGGGGQNNPMNSSQGNYPDTPGSWNVAHVKDYPTPEVGVTETIATLENGFYPSICAAFRAGVGLEHPDGAAAAELGTWSGGGYHAITPVVVPMPPEPSYHYDWYDDTKIEVPSEPGSRTMIKEAERTVVENYDRARKHPVADEKQLKVMRAKLVIYHERIVKTEQTSKDPDGKLFHRAYRKPRIEARAKGEIVKPDLG